MVIKLLQQSTFRRYAAIMLSPFFFIFASKQASKFILPNCKNNSETGYQKTRRSSMLFSMCNCAVNWCDKLCFFAFITKDFIHAVKHAHSEYALFLQKSAQTSLTGREEKKKEKAEEAKRVDQRTRKHLQEQLAEQAQLEMAQIAEQETARQLISEASQKLSEAVQGKANSLQGAKVAQAMLILGNELATCLY